MRDIEAQPNSIVVVIQSIDSAARRRFLHAQTIGIHVGHADVVEHREPDIIDDGYAILSGGGPVGAASDRFVMGIKNPRRISPIRKNARLPDEFRQILWPHFPVAIATQVAYSAKVKAIK